MKIILKYLFLFSLGFGITSKSFSPNIKISTKDIITKLNEVNLKKNEEERRQFIIDELEKPVLDFYIPVDTGQISCVYGYRKVNEKKEFHNGIDIGIVGNASLKFAERPEVIAAASGIVDFADSEAGYGKVVKIKHQNNIETIYAHLNKFFVKEGDTILSKQKIGEMGRSGNARSDKKGQKIHLHFEARKNNKPFNPDKYFKGYKKVCIDDTLYSSNSENNFVYSFPVENAKQPENKILPSIKDTPLGTNSFYEIQVAASLNHLSKIKIKNLEKTYECSVKENKINGIYKYSIKQFKSIEDALDFKNSINSKNNLGIMIYKDNKIIETRWY